MKAKKSFTYCQTKLNTRYYRFYFTSFLRLIFAYSHLHYLYIFFVDFILSILVSKYFKCMTYLMILIKDENVAFICNKRFKILKSTLF